MPTLSVNETIGFELDEPADQDRYWLTYMLWGRLSYDPKAPDRVWMTELQRRFGTAAGDVMEAYRNTTVEAPSTNAKEAVKNRIQGIASARQTPLIAAAHLQKLAVNLEQAVERIKKSVDPENKEWKSSEDDFVTLAAIAKYYCRMQMAADQLEVYEQTGADSGLYAAQREIRGAARQWVLIANKYPLPQPDVKQIEERVKLYEQSEHEARILQQWPPSHARPAMEHIPPSAAIANQPLPVTLKLPHGCKVRLYYGPASSTMENESGRFTIPADAVQLRRDLTYYFEVFDNQGSAWFQPDPLTQTPFYIVKVLPAPPLKDDPGKAPLSAVSK